MPKQCPNTYASGCRCPECHLGLLTYRPTTDLANALARVRATLHVVTPGPNDTPDHDPRTCTLMVCPHEACITHNARRAAQGAGHANPFKRAAA